MEMTIARYRAADPTGRLHLIEELVDEQDHHWLALNDGTPVAITDKGSFTSVRGDSFLLIGRG
ncbi:hypothetical protein [Sphingomonas sp.]|uniref:hypothetical protein n=1 Tax=Sphingomonas sp. TaxID=28214 RepID=UPI0025CF5410|nr:hypothetical protein [Sphingomonas sp.]MBV9528581.1 hypothetical protein [Sphingomonas sp.]